MSPVISLLIPCSDFRPEAVYSSLYQRMDATEPLGKAKFPVFFPVNGNFDPETGSQVTASSARTLLRLAAPLGVSAHSRHEPIAST
jgi:hypothetical protein